MPAPVALITGCSTGIGRELAIRLSQNGYRVVATARRPETLSDLPAALTLPLDVEREESVAAAVAATLQALGRIDVLVNNAGYGQLGPVETTSDAALHKVFEVNVHGPARMLRAVAPVMRRQGSGRIINISSVAGRYSFPTWGPYCASKFALEALSDAARMELAPFGVQVVIIEPGPIRTEFENTARAQTSADATGDPVYHRMSEMAARALTAMNRVAPGPDAVTRVILKAITAPRPRARYQAPASAWLMVRLAPLLGGSGLDWAVRRMARR